MSYFINDECIGCGACVDTCPVEAIIEKGGVYIIDSTECVDCGACETSCPVGAINMVGYNW